MVAADPVVARGPGRVWHTEPVEKVEPVDDEQLVCLLRKGDRDAFRSLVRRHHASMLRVASAFVNGREAAEDVVQETWLAVTRGVDRFEGRSSLRTWIFAILVNQARTRGTSDARTRTATSTLDELGPEDLVPADRFTGSNGRGKWSPPLAAWQNDPQLRSDHAAGLAELATAISELPLRRRQVLVLRDIEGWTAPEVTQLLGVTEGNQRVLLHRARNTLRRRLEQGTGVS